MCNDLSSFSRKNKIQFFKAKYSLLLLHKYCYEEGKKYKHTFSTNTEVYIFKYMFVEHMFREDHKNI